MPLKEADGYHVGQHGWIDVLDSSGNHSFRVRGEIVSLIPASDNAIYALIRTEMGSGVFRVR